MNILIKSLALVGISTLVGVVHTQAGVINPTASPNPVCYGSTSTFNATHYTGATYYWYLGTDKNSGSLLASGLNKWTVTTPALGGTATWCVYMQAGTLYGPETFVVTVNAKSAPPTSAAASVNPVCSGSSTLLSLAGGGGGTGETIKWYTGSCGGTAVGTGNGLSVNPTTTTTYYGRYEDGGPCNFVTACASVTVTVDPPSVGGTATATASTVCSGSDTTITLTGNTGAIQWYSSPDCASWVPISGATSPTLNTGPLTTTTCFVATSTSGNCSYAISSLATVTVNAIPSTPVASNGGPVCVGQTLYLFASTVSAATYFWTGPNNFTSSVQNPTISGATTAAAGTYSCYVTVNGCTSAAGTTYATVNAVPAAPTTDGASICGSGTANLSASGSGGTLKWYSDPGLTTQVATGSAYSPTVSSTSTYYVTETSAAGCMSPATTVTATVNTVATSAITGSNLVQASESGVTYSVALTSGSSYVWSAPTGAIITSGATGPNNNEITVNFGSAAGNVSVTETSASVCVGATVLLPVNVNHPPLAAVLNAYRTVSESWKIALSDLATNWSDVDGNKVLLKNVNLASTNGVILNVLGWSTNNGAIVITNNAYLFYSNNNNVADQISYGIADGFGGTNIGIINILLQSNMTGSESIAGITNGNPTTLVAYGIPGINYITERSTNMSVPGGGWFNIATNKALTNGVISVTDYFIDMSSNPPVQAFYRLKWQP